MKRSFDENCRQIYTELKTEWEQYRPLWQDISKFVGIRVDNDYKYKRGKGNKARDLDEFVDDPTSSISVNQAGDYALGVIWGTGDGVFDIVPSRYVTELVDAEAVSDFYAYATDQALYHMNHHSAGLNTAFSDYIYDQFAFGTSGVGCFPNNDFKTNIEENALVFQSYGIDSTMIDEGKNGLPDIVASICNWRVNRIIDEFCKEGGEVSEDLLAKMPREIQQAWTSKNLNDVFQLVFLVYPRKDFDPKLKGKRGARYKGIWFMEDGSVQSPFHEEDFFEKPIAIARAVKVRGEVYGRSSGTMLMSTIRSVNFMVGTAIEIVDKMSNPTLGMYSNALFGDSVLDTSPDGLTVFNNSLAETKGSPVFPLYDVGDPAAIMNFLVPYLNEKIVTAFKVDTLLDFASSKEMTATESLQRYAIRGKSLAGFLLQQKNEMLVPICKRAISVLLSLGELGLDPKANPEVAMRLQKIGKQARVIPDAVLQVISDGKPWYELRFHNELEKLVRTENVQNLIQVIQTITAVAQLYPSIVEAIDWYKLVDEINDSLSPNNGVMIGPKAFKEIITAQAQQQQAMMAAQMGQTGAETEKSLSEATKNRRETQ
jgi:hypothetical protein